MEFCKAQRMRTAFGKSRMLRAEALLKDNLLCQERLVYREPLLHMHVID